MTRDGEARMHFGGESIEGLRFAPLGRVKLFPHRDAPAVALEQTLRELLGQVSEVRVAVGVSKDGQTDRPRDGQSDPPDPVDVHA